MIQFNKEKIILIDGEYKDEPRVVLLNSNNQIEDFEYKTQQPQIKGNIYLAVVKRIEPSLQAAFVDYGNEQKGFLPMSEIVPAYYNINNPVKRRKPQINPIPTEKLKKLDFSNEIVSEDEDEDTLDIDAIKHESDITDSELIEESSGSNRKNGEKQFAPNIQDVLKRGQVLLVQAQKDPRGSKGASFTTNIALAGRYCVLLPNKPKGHGISKKISKPSERKKLRKFIEQLTFHSSEDVSLIIRTSCRKVALADIKKDYEYIANLWNNICQNAGKNTAPSFIHAEEGIIQRTVRDTFNSSVKEILVQGADTYQETLSCMKSMLPDQESRVRLYDGIVPIFTSFDIEKSISELYQPVVELSSGGYLVINPAEGLTLIDVNSGKSNTQQNVEETALKTNLEAAVEIARQVKLRDISGLIVVDFIDMRDNQNRFLIKKVLDKAFQKDSAKINIGSLSQFGLLEMSRQRINSSFLETTTVMCSTCKGKGLIRSAHTNDMLILRTIESEIATHTSPISEVNIFGHIDTVLSLLNRKRKELVQIEKKYNVKINLQHDPEAAIESFSIEKITSDRPFQEENDEWNFSANPSNIGKRIEKDEEYTDSY
jgi:ribonuclease E